MLRQERGVTLQTVADATNMKVARVGALEKQRNRKPQPAARRALARYYNVSEKWLLEGGKREPFDGPADIESETNNAARAQILENYQAKAAQLLAAMTRELGRL